MRSWAAILAELFGEIFGETTPLVLADFLWTSYVVLWSGFFGES